MNIDVKELNGIYNREIIVDNDCIFLRSATKKGEE